GRNMKMQQLFDDPEKIITHKENSKFTQMCYSASGVAVCPTANDAHKWDLLGGFVRCYGASMASLEKPPYQRLYAAIRPYQRHGEGTLGWYGRSQYVTPDMIITLVKDAGV